MYIMFDSLLEYRIRRYFITNCIKEESCTFFLSGVKKTGVHDKERKWELPKEIINKNIRKTISVLNSSTTCFSL